MTTAVIKCALTWMALKFILNNRLLFLFLFLNKNILCARPRATNDPTSENKKKHRHTQSSDDNKCDGVDNKIKTKQHARNSRTEMYTNENTQGKQNTARRTESKNERSLD